MSKNLDRNVSEPDISGRKNSFITRNAVFFLCGICIVGFFVRMYYFPFDIPIIHDSIDYFSYAVVVSQQGHFPLGWELSNNGWPTFLSIFYAISNDGGIWEFIYIQRMLTVVISVLTIIPVYLLCTRFVPTKYAIIGSTFFIMDPRIISNSFLGITETSYVFLGALALFLFLSKRFPIILISFFTLALCSTIRYEGFLLFIPFVIIFFIRFRKDKKIILKIFLLIGIFFLTITPMMLFTYEATGNDGIISPIFGGMGYVDRVAIQGQLDIENSNYDSNEGKGKLLTFMTVGLTNLLKYMGWVLIPTFVFFVPLGFFIILKKRDFKTSTIFLVGIVMLIPAFYAYARGIEETRYLYFIFPIFCVFSSFTLMKLYDMVPRKWLGTLLICGILIGSVMFLDYQKVDYEHERESYLIAKEITKIASGINHYSPESKYIHIAEIEQNWPIIPLPKETPYDQTYEIKKISPDKYSTLEDYIQSSEDKGLTHLVIKKEGNHVKFLEDIFHNEEKYSYLIKQYDSSEYGFDFKIKMYEIDYIQFKKIYK